MDVPAYSVALSQAKIQEAAGVMIMKKAMEINQNNADMMVQALPQAGGPNPLLASLGAKIDIRI